MGTQVPAATAADVSEDIQDGDLHGNQLSLGEGTDNTLVRYMLGESCMSKITFVDGTDKLGMRQKLVSEPFLRRLNNNQMLEIYIATQ